MKTLMVSLFLPYTLELHSKRVNVSDEESVRTDAPLKPLSWISRARLLNGPSSHLEPTIEDSQPLPLDCRSTCIPVRDTYDPLSAPEAQSFEADWIMTTRASQSVSHMVNHCPLPPLDVSHKQSMAPSTKDYCHGTSEPVSLPTTNAPWSIVLSRQVNEGVVNAVYSAVGKAHAGDVTWIGTLGCTTNTISESAKADIRSLLQNNYNSALVLVPDEELDAHYKHFCQNILWPVLHYQQQCEPKTNAHETRAWQSYQAVNAAFAERILESYQTGDSIWIHDYYLMLVPSLVRARIPDASILFFLHTPFPSSELFRCLAQRDDLLRGILGASLIGFQTQDYVRHFLRTCARLLAVRTLPIGVQLACRFVDVTCMPIGTVPDDLRGALLQPEVAQHTSEIIERYRHRKMIVSRSRLDITTGVRQLLLAFRLFLYMHPDRRDDVVLIQIAQAGHLNRSGSVTAYAEEIYRLVNEINAQFSSLTHQPVMLLEREISRAEYLALLQLADVYVAPALREGLDLGCFDFIVAQSLNDFHQKSRGVLVVSEFAGASKVLVGSSMTINPWDTTQLAQTLRASLDMPADERQRRHSRLLDIVSHNDGVTWFLKLLERLRACSSGRDQHCDFLSSPNLLINE